MEDVSGILGRVQGERLDLALAYGLGISDEELVKDKLDTMVDLSILDRIAKLVF